MTVKRVLEAHRAFLELLDLKLSYGKVRQLHSLAVWLEKEMAIYRAEERRSAEEWKAKIGADGLLAFPDAEARSGYVQRIQEVQRTDVEDWPRVLLTEDDLLGQRITLQGMMALEGFIEFGGDEIGPV